MTQFITLAGRKQVGKDTSARMIEAVLQHNGVDASSIHVVHFADALKKACHIIFGIPLEDMETEEGKQRLTRVRWPDDECLYSGSGWRPNPEGAFMTVREVLQFVGTDLFRNQMDPDIWLNSVFLKPWKENNVVIIADARFPNEAALGRKNGLLINIQRDTGLESDGHRSENALDDFKDYHYVVQNNSSFDDLQTQLEDILDTCYSN